jgi:DNA polymerase (family X)
MDNQQIANIFQEIGDLLEIDGANRFRVLAYQNAAENIRGMGQEIKEIWKKDPAELENIPGIGEDLRLKIEEMLSTGNCEYHVKLLKKYGRGLLDILEIRSIGPKKAALFYHELGIDNITKLKTAAVKQKLRALPRMGEKSENEILRAIEEHSKYSHRMLLSEALPLAKEIVMYMREFKGTTQVEYAGSLRRRKETIGDLDILAAANTPSSTEKIIKHFQKFLLVKNVIASGPTKSSVILKSGAQVDLRVIETKSFGAAWHYFTGSKDHNIEIRTFAQKAKKKINEYGIFDLIQHKKGQPVKEKFIIGDTEEHLYKAVGLHFIPPPLRETRGEFQAAMNNELPTLIEPSDILGDLNINSNYGEGKASPEKICQAAIENKLKYIAFSDLFKSSEATFPFNEKYLEKQLTEISKLKKQFPKLHIFKSLKLQINKDGSLDLPPQKLLEQLDFLMIKITHNFNLNEPAQTKRILTALAAHPKVKILSCPTSRILNQREPIPLNLKKIMEFCAKNNKALEINSQPHQLDLPDIQIKTAIENNTQLCINSDLKNTSEFDYLKYGAWTAQRGWAEKKNILNTQPLKNMIKLLSLLSRT